MKINEIFYSLQGEGKWTGLPNIFIRTTGCNLRCCYCDTKYAYSDGEEKSIDEIIKIIKKYTPCKHVCITGGEPLIHNEIWEFIDFLLKEGYKICLETNGSKNIEKITDKKNLLISMDVKCPSSDMHEKMLLNNIDFLRKEDQLKFIIQDEKDYIYAKKIIEKYKPNCMVFFQPLAWTRHASVSLTRFLSGEAAH